MIMEDHMTADRLSRAFGSIESMLLALGSATRAAGAVNAHREPAPADLARLGIQADAFKAIRRP